MAVVVVLLASLVAGRLNGPVTVTANVQ